MSLFTHHVPTSTPTPPVRWGLKPSSCWTAAVVNHFLAYYMFTRQKDGSEKTPTRLLPAGWNTVTASSGHFVSSLTFGSEGRTRKADLARIPMSHQRGASRSWGTHHAVCLRVHRKTEKESGKHGYLVTRRCDS